jgi:hypothetical protein
MVVSWNFKHIVHLGSVTNTRSDGVAAGSGSSLSTVQANVTATVSGQSAPVSFAGLSPGFIGLYQVNVTVPTGLTSGNAVPVVVKVSNLSSNAATIAVQGAVSASPLFLSLTATPTFQLVGYPSGVVVLTMTPNAGNVTFSASVGSLNVTGGILSNQGTTITFAPQQVTGLGSFFDYASGGLYRVSSFSLSVTLTQTFALGQTAL